MPNETLMGATVRLTSAMEAVAAIAAHVRVESEGIDVEPRVRELLAAIVTEIVGELPALDDGSGAQTVGMVRALLRQAADLVDEPGRTGPWAHVDEALLQGMGRLSMAIAGAFRAAEGTLDGFGARLAAPGSAFLDVGTGTGWLAIATARAYPAARVAGIDLFAPALDLARRNVAAEGLEDRVELQLLDVVDLDAKGVYDAIWLPMPFLPGDVVPGALAASVRALRSGGWVLAGMFAAPPDRLSQLLLDLRTVRSGGHPWQPEEIVEMIGRHGFDDVREVPRTWAAPVRLYAGRRP
ncbi:MAG: cyclopropane-fatty-acyl-phospholipid synthase family protein [Acidimicrobiia bacterium]